MPASLTREQLSTLEDFGRKTAKMLGKRPSPTYGVAIGFIASVGSYTYDVLMKDGATLEEVPCLVSALGGSVGDEVRVEFVQGRALVTGVVATSMAPPKVLWSGSGWYMDATKTCNLSETLNSQKNGIVLHWQGYSGGVTQDSDHNYFFVPKSHAVETGKGVSMWLNNASGSAVSTKYLYVYDDKVTGNDNNSRDQTTVSGSGVTVTPKYFVLTEILGI